MMTFDLDKDKIITVSANVMGIDTSVLRFYFRLNVNNVEYGFSGTYDEGKITIHVPALKLIFGLLDPPTGEFPAKLEASSILDDGSGYYNLLWSGMVLLKFVPVITVDMESETVEETQPTITTTLNSLEEQDVEVVPSDETTETIDSQPAIEETPVVDSQNPELIQKVNTMITFFEDQDIPSPPIPSKLSKLKQWK